MIEKPNFTLRGTRLRIKAVRDFTWTWTWVGNFNFLWPACFTRKSHQRVLLWNTIDLVAEVGLKWFWDKAHRAWELKTTYDGSWCVCRAYDVKICKNWRLAGSGDTSPDTRARVWKLEDKQNPVNNEIWPIPWKSAIQEMSFSAQSKFNLHTENEKVSWLKKIVICR